MRIAGMKSCSLVDGPGVRFAIFTQGCPHRCPGCHNAHTWDPAGGYSISTDELSDMIWNHKRIDGVTISGGEPFDQQEECVKLLKQIPKYLNVCIYTGYEWDEIKDTELARMADYVVVGKFEQDKKINGKYYGSSNQRIIYVKTGKEVEF